VIVSLTAEWTDRIRAWIDKLSGQFFRKVADAPLEGFVTGEMLTPTQAAGGSFQPMPFGSRWGAKYDYGWFRTTVTIPDELAGQTVVYRIDCTTDKGTLVYVNGVLATSREHEVYLTRDAAGGESFEVLAEIYAGHGPRHMPCHAGPLLPGESVLAEVPPEQEEVKVSEFGVWDEQAYQLWVDMEALWSLREALPADSLRVAEIDAALQEATFAIDFEQPLPERQASYLAGRDVLRPLLQCSNGSTSPTMFAFGHGHLDIAWLWPLAETQRKIARTLANQLELAERYPGYGFLQSQAHLFWMLRRTHPDLYLRVKEAVCDGGIIADGAAWVEFDTNVSGGEAIVRQLLRGKAFFREEFGVESEMLWLPDVFGYSGALPQILRGCGVKYFSTQKIFWTYHGGDPFPHNTFTWRGIDGSEVFAHIHTDYNSRTDPGTIVRRWESRVQKDGVATRLFPFGWGDGGGGPERTHLEFARRCKDLEGCPKFRLAHPVEFFVDQIERGWPDVEYVGELYLQVHRGTLTSQARTKRGNRKSEIALREAEMWTLAAAKLAGGSADPRALDDAWREVMLNQFHDILPGSSIDRVYQEAEAGHERAIARAEQATDEATGALLGGGSGDESQGVTIFNSLGWDRSVTVELPEGQAGATDAEGDVLCVQEVEGRRMVETTVPSCGWTSLRRAEGPRAGCGGGCGVSASPGVLENDRLRVGIGERGEVVSMVDKQTGREWLAGAGNDLRMYKDVPTKFDAWDIDSMYEFEPVELDAEAEIEVVAAGALVGIVRVRRTLGRSTMVQDIVLHRRSTVVEFRTRIEWNEDHRMLKVAFRPAVHTDELISEIQFGHLARPTHRSRPYDADRFEVCNHRWSALAESTGGLAVLNDCKYGISARGNEMELTLLRAPKAPDPDADKGAHEFVYAAMPFSGPLSESGVVRAAYELNVPAVVRPGVVDPGSAWSVDSPRVAIEAVKVAEDGSGDAIVRLYECTGGATRCVLASGLPVASWRETDMLEAPLAGCASGDGPSAELSFRAFEIKTVRFSFAR
jgi:alpha-mannosidase